MQGTTQAFGETFAPLRNRNVSLYLSGQAVSLVGTWMQVTAQSWVVWQLSHSARDLGLVAMLGSLPLLLLGAFAGVWADRLDRRKVLVGTQLGAMLLAFLFAILVQGGWIQLWHVFMLAFALGCINALDMPAQAAFVGDLAGVDQVRRAVVLNAMVMQVSRTIGPALAGWVMGAVGVGPTFWLNGASFLAVIASLLAVQAHQARKPNGGNRWREMSEPFHFMMREPRIQDLLIFSTFVTFFVFASVQLIPAIVTDYLQAGPETLGLIMGASGAGALTSSLVVVPLTQRIRRTGWVIAGALLWMGAWFGLAVWVESSWFWIASMFLGGLGGPVVMTTTNGFLQVLAPPTMKARLLSLWVMISFGMQPFGFLLVAYTGHLLGVPGAILFNGMALILGPVALLLLRPGLRHWQPVSPGSKTHPGRMSQEEQYGRKSS